MPHFTLEHSDFVDDQGLVCDSVRFDLDDEDLLDFPWLQGVAFAAPPAQPIAMRLLSQAAGEVVLYDYLKSPVPMVSTRLKHALEAAGVSNVEYFSTRVEGRDALDQDPAYWAINVIGKSLMADPQQSVSHRAFGQAGADLFSRFVPRSDIEPGLRLFRMAEHLSTLVIDHHVVQACIDAGIDTLQYEPLARWLR